MPDPSLDPVPAAPSAEDHAHVAQLIARAHLAPTETELEAFAKSYLMLRAGIDSLYAVPEARYEVPALVFGAEPTFEDWAR
jgi:hypothetical protein